MMHELVDRQTEKVKRRRKVWSTKKGGGGERERARVC